MKPNNYITPSPVNNLIMNKKGLSTVEKLKEILTVRRYAPSTIKTYCYYAELFLSMFDKNVYHISQKEAIDAIGKIKYTSISQQNQFISSVKLLYRYVVGSKLFVSKIERPRKQKRLPRVVFEEELNYKLDRIRNTKHRAMLTLGYRCGLRVSEVCNIEVRDVDTVSMQLLVRNSKFNKDRYVAISQDTIHLLMWYCEEYDPQDYLFEGQNGKYSTSSCQNIFKKYIDENKSWHTLRHSYATTLVERNVNFRTIQMAMGHESPNTTMIYSHVSRKALQEAAL